MTDSVYRHNLGYIAGFNAKDRPDRGQYCRSCSSIHGVLRLALCFIDNLSQLGSILIVLVLNLEGLVAYCFIVAKKPLFGSLGIIPYRLWPVDSY